MGKETLKIVLIQTLPQLLFKFPKGAQKASFQ